MCFLINYCMEGALGTESKSNGMDIMMMDGSMVVR
jgi:hypothetical protein